MKKTAVLLMCLLAFSVPSFARASRHHLRAQKTPSAIAAVWTYLLQLAGLEKAGGTTPPPPPTSTTQDGGSCTDPNGCVKPKP